VTPPDLVALVEWADKVESTLPREHLRIEIHVLNEYERRFEIMARAVFGKFKACLTMPGVNAFRAESGAVNIIYKRDLAGAKDPAGRRKELVAEYTARFANPYVAAERGYIDDVIEPGRTRLELIRALRIALRKERTRSPKWHGNIPL